MKLIILPLFIITLCAPGFGKKPITLGERYTRASCAVVQITHDGGSGTGFYISATGDLLTASHVALNKIFSEPAPGQFQINIDYKSGLRITRNGETSPLKLPKLSSDDALAQHLILWF